MAVGGFSDSGLSGPGSKREEDSGLGWDLGIRASSSFFLLGGGGEGLGP